MQLKQDWSSIFWGDLKNWSAFTVNLCCMQVSLHVSVTIPSLHVTCEPGGFDWATSSVTHCAKLKNTCSIKTLHDHLCAIKSVPLLFLTDTPTVLIQLNNPNQYFKEAGLLVNAFAMWDLTPKRTCYCLFIWLCLIRKSNLINHV